MFYFLNFPNGKANTNLHFTQSDLIMKKKTAEANQTEKIEFYLK
jgi:hypothetical protein